MQRSWLTLAVLPLLLPGGERLETAYTAGKTLRVVSETNFLMETVDFEMLVDGEPVEGRGGRGGGNSEEVRRVVQVDTWREAKDGAPTKVERSFEELEATAVRSFGEEEREMQREAPLAGVTLRLERGEGGLEVEVVDGDEPDDDALLEGHAPELSLDALLPDEDVEVDASWELDRDAIFAALGLDLEDVLFPQPPREEPEEGGRGRGRGGPGGPRSPFAPFRELDWSGKATVTALSEDFEGQACARITLEIRGDGQLESRRGPGGALGTGRALELAAPRETTFTVELEGALYFSRDAKLPIALDLEGSVKSDREDTFTRGESTRTLILLQEGDLSHSVRVEVGTADAPAEDQ